jgi:hypothetical protein
VLSGPGGRGLNSNSTIVSTVSRGVGTKPFIVILSYYQAVKVKINLPLGFQLRKNSVRKATGKINWPLGSLMATLGSISFFPKNNALGS